MRKGRLGERNPWRVYSSDLEGGGEKGGVSDSGEK